MKTIGERIRELREDRDLSLRELATTVGVSAAFMSDVELGRRQPSDKHMAALARALDTPLDDLQQFDTRPPLKEFRRATLANPGYGFAFRQLMDKRISPEELLEFLRHRDDRQQEGESN
ncbi:MAG: helix-turn-helix transcriptional regulator [Chloroflexota bacterium]|nr:helix-turn-helix transcriptional regulator [Chloroflexota bacterium]